MIVLSFLFRMFACSLALALCAVSVFSCLPGRLRLFFFFALSVWRLDNTSFFGGVPLFFYELASLMKRNGTLTRAFLFKKRRKKKQKKEDKSGAVLCVSSLHTTKKKTFSQG